MKKEKTDVQKIVIDSGEAFNKLKECKLVLTDDNLYPLYKDKLPECFVIPAGEKSKTLDSAKEILNEMAYRGIKRSDCVGAFGGGVVGDLLGFAASIYMRGIRWINVPTSLLAMADSSIGGKTAVNLGDIKNAIGTFHLSETYIETSFLDTLPEAEYESGMGEIIKTSCLDPTLFDMMQAGADIKQLISRCVTIKNNICDNDFMDKGVRRCLNIGHTVGHAIELVTGLKHGVCVTIGLKLETLMMRERISEPFFYELQVRLSRFIKDIDFPDVEKITEIAMHDKKNDSGIDVIFPVDVGKYEEVTLSKEEFAQRLKNI